MAGNFVYYHYDPTLAGAVIFILLFTCITLQHAIQALRYRAYFMLPVVIGGFCKASSRDFVRQ